MTQSTLPPEARHLVEQGFKIFPCNAKKRPLTENGFYDATDDLTALDSSWPAGALIGMPTGRPQDEAHRLLVIDLDPTTTDEGDLVGLGHTDWDALVAQHGLPDTYQVTTGRGGLHIYFRTDQIIMGRTAVREHVDTRSEGGYVIAPGSVSVYGEYFVSNDKDILPAPQWVIDFAKSVDPAKVNRRRTGQSASAPARTTPDPLYDSLTDDEKIRVTAYTDKAVQGEIGRLQAMQAAATADIRTYSGEPWDATVYAVACNLLEFANAAWSPLTENEAHALLMTHSPQDAGFTDLEIQKKWDSARRKVHPEGRVMPVTPVGSFVPFVGGNGQPIQPDAFFGKGGLDATLLAQAVLDIDPLAVEDVPDRPTWEYQHGVWVRNVNAVDDRVIQILGPKYRPNHTSVVERIVKRQLYSGGRIITAEPVKEFINVRNGLLDWKTGVLHPHDPDVMSTVQLPVEWEPNAKCPNIESFIGQVMASDAVEYMWEILGYMLYSGNPLQRAVLFHGNGQNGKGTLIRVLQAVLGSKNTSSVSLRDITEGKFEVASLQGKIANLAGDIDPAYMKQTAMFKAITGEDKISAQRKYENSFEFTCWATPLFSANQFWKSSDTTSGYMRRWVVVPFPRAFGHSATLTGDLTTDEEKRGFLVKAVEHLRTLMARGDFDIPLSAQEEKVEFAKASDQVREWLDDDEEKVIKADPSDQTLATPRPVAYKAYTTWCEQNGVSALPASHWKSRLETLGYQIRKRQGTWTVIGMDVDSGFRAII